MQNRGSDFHNNFISDPRFKDVFDDIPSMKNSIILSVMISTTIPSDFKFTSDSEGAV